MENASAVGGIVVGRTPELCHLNQIELARRWRISPRTLERWRWRSQGPRYLKMGGRIVYRFDDLEAFEAAQVREPGSGLARTAGTISPTGG